MKRFTRKPILILLGIVFVISIAIFRLDIFPNDSIEQPIIQFLDGPDRALIHNSYMLRDPNEDRVPYERLLRIKEKIFTSINSRSSKSSQDLNWKNIDTEIPGRARALYYESASQTLFSGSVTGGLWKNTDYKNNEKWNLVEGFEGTAVNCIVTDPNDPNTLYLGTGESFTAFVNYRESTGLGNGIFKSSDSGVNWEWINTTEGFYYVNDLAVRDESGMSVLYAAVGSGEYRGQTFVQEGLYKSADQGVTWSQVLPNLPGLENTYQISDIEISENGRIFLGTMRNSEDTGGSIILYSDDAQNWSIYTGFNDFVDGLGEENFAGRSIVKTAPSNPNHVYAVFSRGGKNELDQLRDFYTEIWQSRDAGVTWSQISHKGSIYSLPWHAMSLAVDPNDENKILAGGLEVYVLNDASAASITDLDWIRLSSWAAKFIVDFNPDLTEEEQQAYLDKYVHADIHDIQFIGNSSEEVLITTDGGVFHSSNIGLTNNIDPENPIQEFPVFETLTNGLNTTQYYHASLHSGEGRMEVVGGTQDNGSIYRNFTTGQEREDNISGGDGGYSFFDSDNDNLKITMVYGNRYYIHINEDTYFDGEINGLFVNPVDYDDKSNLIYSNTATSTYGGLYASLKGRYYDSLEIFNVNKFLGTADLGLETISYVKLNAGLQEAITAIKLSKESESLNKTAIIGTENGQVFKVTGLPYNVVSTKLDDGQLPIGYISSVDIGSNENTILVTISNFGLASVWMTIDNGQNWMNLERDLPDMPVRWGRINPSDDNKVVIATEMGVWGLENIEDEDELWQNYNAGLPAMRVDMIDLRASDNTILAATHGQGLYIGEYFQQTEDESEVLGIDENIYLEDKMQFYPNPVKDILNITNNSNVTNVRIFNIQGKLVFSSKIDSNHSINVNSLANGTFVINGYNNLGQLVANQTIIRNK